MEAQADLPGARPLCAKLRGGVEEVVGGVWAALDSHRLGLGRRSGDIWDKSRII